jgi:hypothetical protein
MPGFSFAKPLIAFKFPSRTMPGIAADAIGRNLFIGGKTLSTVRKNDCVVTA